MASEILTEWFNKLKVDYTAIRHKRVETALQTAYAEGESPEHVAKVVVVKAGGEDKMFVIPADHKLDLFKAADATGKEDVRVEYEFEILEKFPDSELGAMHPFGPLYGIPSFVDSALTEHKDIVFNAGDHEVSYKVKTEDFIDLARPQIGDYSEPKTKATSR